ncbi:competence type IV pilus minor pilin ComGF [Tuberibacillus sp. Marseille-P3662]|uniref:competence type IV pilus minor pilin ComGF n=1 Tax=Tuberibacillus sp. Marseille-P3662 TaxID=1965358 RepID=UPI000A1C8138|nr:competence type IV pilus minor pilin ComGF [Tuberibacillus sp. Marseille-P3662]
MKMSNAGFSLLSSIIAFMIVMTILYLSAQMFLVMAHLNISSDTQSNHIRLFFEQVKHEVHASSSMSCEGSQMILQKNHHVVDYQLNGRVLRRAVDGSGYDVVLQSMSTIQFTCGPSTVNIRVQDQKGRPYEWSVLRFVKE